MTRRKRVFKSCIDGQMRSSIGAPVTLPATLSAALPLAPPATLSVSSSMPEEKNISKIVLWTTQF